ncbi:MAG: PQQ-binding-like beta-propeller repeat protein, partial [Candidatus Binatia bacterium]
AYLLSAFFLAGAAVTAREAAATCAAPAPGGEWRSLNHDLHNSRNQTAEAAIDVTNVTALAPAYKFRAADVVANQGAFQSTPIVADGCVYVGSSTGWVFALAADDLSLVWVSNSAGTPDPLDGFVLGLAVENGLVYAFPSEKEPFGPHAVALDQSTGEVAWQTARLNTPPVAGDPTTDGPTLHASPVVFDGMAFVALSRGIGARRVPHYFLNALTGDVIKQVHFLSETEVQQGYGGAGMWSTPAVDLDTKTMYAGTADSEAFKRQHRYNNAILKIRADANDPDTLGTVLDAYSGVQERYVDPVVPGLEKNPLCEMFGGPDDPLGGTSPSSSNSCLELDVDFGASPTLFLNDEGGGIERKMIGEMQKAGVFHAIYAEHMQLAWARIISYPSPTGNAGTAAYDGKKLYVSANPGSLFAFDKTTGFPEWAGSSGGDALRYQPMTYANGVVYTVNNAGNLIAVDAATGVPLLNRPVSVDADGEPCVAQGGGVAVARNTVYVQCDLSGWVIAYRLPP